MSLNYKTITEAPLPQTFSSREIDQVIFRRVHPRSTDFKEMRCKLTKALAHVHVYAQHIYIRFLLKQACLPVIHVFFKGWPPT